MEYKGEDRRMNDITDVRFELQKVDARLDAVDEKLKTMAANSKDIKITVGEIKTLLLGNGKTGIISKVNILWGGSLFVVGAIVTLLIRSFVL